MSDFKRWESRVFREGFWCGSLVTCFVFALFLLSGCASVDLPRVAEPLSLKRDSVNVKVFWKEKDGEDCPRGTLACSTTVKNFVYIHSRQPRDFNDWNAVCHFGHEVLHGLE